MLDQFLDCPVTPGVALSAASAQGMVVSGACPKAWSELVASVFPDWHTTRSAVAFPSRLGPQYQTLQIPFLYAFPIGVDGQLYAALRDLVVRANAFVRWRYPSPESVAAAVRPMLAELVPPLLHPKPFFQEESVQRYARLVHTHLHKRSLNLLLDFAVVRLAQGPGLCVTEMQTSHPYFSFSRLLDCARASGLVQCPQLPTPGLGLQGLHRRCLVVDAQAGHPSGTFFDDLRFQARQLGTGELGPIALETACFNEHGEVCFRSAQGERLRVTDFGIYLRATLQEIPEAVQRLVMAGDFEGVRALHAFLNGPMDNVICLNLAEQALLSKGNMHEFRDYLGDHPWTMSFLPQSLTEGHKIRLEPGKYVLKPCSGNSGKGLQRVFVARDHKLLRARSALAASGVSLRNLEGRWGVLYDAHCEVPVEARVDFITAQKELVLGQECVAQPLFSQARLGGSVIELRACQLMGDSECFVLARKAAAETFSLETAELQATKLNYNSLVGSLVRSQMQTGRSPQQWETYLQGHQIEERLHYGFTCVYPFDQVFFSRLA